MQWWDNLLDLTMQKYQQWLGSDPITRLNVQPPTVAETAAWVYEAGTEGDIASFTDTPKIFGI